MAAAPPSEQLTAVGRLRADLRRVPALGWDLALAVGVLTMVLSSGATEKNDWHYYRSGAAALFGPDGFHLYANHPIYQIGPLGLGVARLVDLLPGSGKTLSVVLTALLLVPVMVLVRRIIGAVRIDPVPTRLLVASWLLIGVGWFSVASISQIGDALALIGTLAAMLALLRGHPLLAGTAFALGVAAKPWTLAALPLLLFTDLPGRVRAFGAALVIGLITWGPFTFADHRTVHAGHLAYVVPPDAWQRVLGIGDVAPSWWRAAQLVVCWAVGVLVWLRARQGPNPATGLLVAGGLTALVRILSEVGTWPYYVSTALPLVLLADLMASRDRRLPIATLLAWLTLFNVGAAFGGGTGAVFRVACLLAALVVLLMPRRQPIGREV